MYTCDTESLSEVPDRTFIALFLRGVNRNRVLDPNLLSDVSHTPIYTVHELCAAPVDLVYILIGLYRTDSVTIFSMPDELFFRPSRAGDDNNLRVPDSPVAFDLHHEFVAI